VEMVVLGAQDIEVIPYLGTTCMEDESYLNISWRIINKMDDFVLVVGYRMYFVGEGGFAGTIPEYFNTGARVLTDLWCEEERSYRIPVVPPPYYGIDESGMYCYRIQISYMLSGEIDERRTEWIPSNSEFVRVSDVTANRNTIIHRLIEPLQDYIVREFGWSGDVKRYVSDKLGEGIFSDIFYVTEDGDVCVVRLFKRLTWRYIPELTRLFDRIARSYVTEEGQAKIVLLAEEFDDKILSLAPDRFICKTYSDIETDGY